MAQTNTPATAVLLHGIDADGPAAPAVTARDTITVPAAAWQRLLSMVEQLNANQAEFNKIQTELLQQLARAHARIQELEHAQSGQSKDVAPPAPMEPSTLPPSSPALGADRRGPVFTYRVKPRTPQNPTPPPKKQKTWAEIAAAPRPALSDVSDSMQEKLRTSLAMLEIRSPAPKPVALYFRNIKRARLGHVRKALRNLFTHPWAVLGLSFIGQSVVEIVCHDALVHQIIAKLRLLGAAHIRNFDIFGDNLRKVTNTTGQDRAATNLERAQARLERLETTCTNAAAKSWYAKQATEAQKRLAQIYQVAHDVETSVSSDSGYASSDVEEQPNDHGADCDRDGMAVDSIPTNSGAASGTAIPSSPPSPDHTAQDTGSDTPMNSSPAPAHEAPPQQ